MVADPHKLEPIVISCGLFYTDAQRVQNLVTGYAANKSGVYEGEKIILFNLFSIGAVKGVSGVDDFVAKHREEGVLCIGREKHPNFIVETGKTLDLLVAGMSEDEKVVEHTYDFNVAKFFERKSRKGEKAVYPSDSSYSLVIVGMDQGWHDNSAYWATIVIPLVGGKSSLSVYHTKEGAPTYSLSLGFRRDGPVMGNRSYGGTTVVIPYQSPADKRLIAQVKRFRTW